MPRPPRIGLWLHERSLAPDERDAIIGDLLEEFGARSAASARDARHWFWSQTFRSIDCQLAAATAVLVSAALLASWVPAFRASRVDPLIALRN